MAGPVVVRAWVGVKQRRLVLGVGVWEQWLIVELAEPKQLYHSCCPPPHLAEGPELVEGLVEELLPFRVFAEVVSAALGVGEVGLELR